MPADDQGGAGKVESARVPPGPPEKGGLVIEHPEGRRRARSGESRWAGFRAWSPQTAVAVGLGIWLAGSCLFLFVGLPLWESSVRETSCSEPAITGSPVPAAALGSPPSAATLSPTVSMARGTGQDAVSWSSGPTAPAHTVFEAASSPLLHGGGGTPIPSSAAKAWVQIDMGTVVVTTCVDSDRLHNLSSGTYAGYAAIPVSDSASPVTVREQFQVQAAYVGWFWPLGLVIVAFAISLVSAQIKDAPKAKRWLLVVTGIGTFSGTYYATALANPAWGGPKAVGTLLAAVFTATVGAVASVAKGAT